MLYTSAFQTPSFHVRRLPILAAVLAALFLVLAACGGDPEPTVPPTLTEESTSVAVAPASTPAPPPRPRDQSGLSPPAPLFRPAPRSRATAPASVSGSAPTPASAPVTPAVVPATPVPTEPAGPPGSPAMDRAALEAFYHALRGPAWDGKPSWGTDAPLGEWTGVSVEDGRVVGLRLGLVKELRGSLPPEIGDLGALRILHINATGLTGPLPPELGKLALLEELRLPATC